MDYCRDCGNSGLSLSGGVCHCSKPINLKRNELHSQIATTQRKIDEAAEWVALTIAILCEFNIDSASLLDEYKFHYQSIITDHEAELKKLEGK